MIGDKNHLWKLLWDYDPNGLLVVDPDLYIQLVNPAFCEMFKTPQEHLIGESLEVIFDDVSNFKTVWQQNVAVQGKIREYPQYGLYVNQAIFAIPEEGPIASIFTDISHELAQKGNSTS